MIAADGEMRASMALAEASGVIENSPAAIKLRHLQVRSTQYGWRMIHINILRGDFLFFNLDTDLMLITLAVRILETVFVMYLFPDPECLRCREKLDSNVSSTYGSLFNVP